MPHKILKKVSIDEAPLGRMMCMQVKIEHNTGVQLLNDVLNCKYGRPE